MLDEIVQLRRDIRLIGAMGTIAGVFAAHFENSEPKGTIAMPAVTGAGALAGWRRRPRSRVHGQKTSHRYLSRP